MVLDLVRPKFEEQSFIIKQSQNWKGSVIFKDVGALIYFLKAIPWLVKNFSVDSYLDHLKKLQGKLKKESKLEFTYSRYLIWAMK